MHVTSINFEIRESSVFQTLKALDSLLGKDVPYLYYDYLTFSSKNDDLVWMNVWLEQAAGRAKEAVKLLLTLEGVYGTEMVSENRCLYGTETLCPVIVRRCPVPYVKA